MIKKKIEITLQIDSKLSILGKNGKILNGSRRKGVGEVKVSRIIMIFILDKFNYYKIYTWSLFKLSSN